MQIYATLKNVTSYFSLTFNFSDFCRDSTPLPIFFACSSNGLYSSLFFASFSRLFFRFYSKNKCLSFIHQCSKWKMLPCVHVYLFSLSFFRNLKISYLKMKHSKTSLNSWLIEIDVTRKLQTFA